MRSDQQRTSRYAKGGTSEVSGDRIKYWERKIFQTSPTDIPFTITSRYNLRPDLLAADLYGKDSLMWFVLQYNNIVDPVTEFVEGAQIVLPTRKRLYSELLSSA